MHKQNAAHTKTLVKRGIAAVIIVGGALTFGSIVLADKHHYPNSPDSFLKYQVDSTSELVEALRADRQLRERYAKHFGIPESHVVDFVKSALVPYQLPEDRAVTTYGVTKTGVVYGVRTRLRKGTKVWANRSGVPILKWLCANPLTKTLPGTKLARARQVKAKPRTKIAGSRPLAPIDIADEIPIAEQPLLSLPPVVTTAMTVPNIPIIPVPPTALIPPGSVVASANYGLLFPVGLVLLSTLSHGGGSGSASSLVGPPIETPEPGSLALVAAAGLPLMGMLYRRRRSQGNTGA